MSFQKRRFNAYVRVKERRFAREARGTNWFSYKGFIVAQAHPQGFAILSGGKLIDHAPDEAEARAKIDLHHRSQAGAKNG